MSLLNVQGVPRHFGSLVAVDNVSMTVAEGKLRAVIGPNGAGKTTTLRSLMGLTPASKGVVRIFGQVTTDWPPYRIAGLAIGFVPEGRRIFANLTVDENLKVPVDRPGPWTIERVYQLFPIIVQEVFKVTVSMRSDGMSILLVEQNVRAAVEIADRAYVLDDGKMVYEGDAAEFGRDEEYVRALAGASAEKWDEPTAKA